MRKTFHYCAPDGRYFTYQLHEGKWHPPESPLNLQPLIGHDLLWSLYNGLRPELHKGCVETDSGVVYPTTWDIDSALQYIASVSSLPMDLAIAQDAGGIRRSGYWCCRLSSGPLSTEWEIGTHPEMGLAEVIHCSGLDHDHGGMLMAQDMYEELCILRANVPTAPAPF